MDKYIGNGMIIYTDGSTYKGNPAPVGFGVHWYLFNNDEESIKKFPISGLKPTTKGYINSNSKEVINFKRINDKEGFINSVVNDDNYYEVNIIKMFDYAQGLNCIGTNNLGELHGFNKALEIIELEKPDISVIYTDSEYVIKCLNYLDSWDKNDWMTTTGKPVQNRIIWEKIYKLKNKLKDDNIRYVVKWIKGHNGEKTKESDSNIHNMFADKLASIGASISNNLKHNVHFVENNTYYKEITFDDLKEDNTPSRIHPMLINDRVYFSFGGRTNKNVFYVGNPGKQIENTFIGKQTPDSQIGIVYIEERDHVIEMIENIQNIWLDKYYGYNNLMFCLNLFNISNSKIYRELSKYGESYISKPSGVPNLETVFNKGLTYVHDPIYLATKNIYKINELDNILESYKNNSKDIISIDITDSLYDTIDAFVKDDIQGNSKVYKVGKKFKKSLSVGAHSIKIRLNIDGFDKTIPIMLSTDLPRRNQLKQMENEFPSVKLLLWRVSELSYSYASLICLHVKTNNDELRLKNYGIWKDANCSLIILD